MMSAAEPRPRRLFPGFHPEAAAVVSLLLGLFQVILAVPLYHLDFSLPRHLFLFPLLVGALIVTAGSFTMACERSPSMHLLRGCAYTNVAGLLGALCALCVYGASLSSVELEECDELLLTPDLYDYMGHAVRRCPTAMLEELSRCVMVLLLLYDLGAALLHSLLAASALKALRHT